VELTVEELKERQRKFIVLMDQCCPEWDTALFIDTVNHYYFTGTMQNGLLLLYKDGSSGAGCLYGVRRSYERAKQESPLASGELLQISTYRDLADAYKATDLGNVYIEGDTMPAAVLERLKKYFQIQSVGFLDPVIRTLRSVKSPYELYWTERSGEQHRLLLEERVPGLFREGMSEAEFWGEVTSEMYKLGYQGLTRFHQPQTELTIGQIGFGTNSLYPSRFDGPGGTKGHSAAAPLSADGDKRLQKGDIVFVDIGFGINGYHSDKTQVYVFGGEAPDVFRRAHRLCMDLEKRIAERLKPGEIPSKIYQTIMASLSREEADCFMGVDGHHQVKFLGHGVGLNVDDLPVIARGFDTPLEENMVISLEPKKGVAGIGMAGVEDTYIVKPGGGYCITGGGREIIRV
jgi:Xaa-Pro aminopeptidase